MTAKQLTASREVTQIPVSGTTVSRFNARQEAGDISGLVVSVILTEGLLEPVVARPVSSGSGYEVIIGSRRLAAAKKAGLKSIPAVVQPMNDDEALIKSVIENVQRSNLSEEDTARAYLTLHDLRPKLWTQEAFAKWIGKSQQYVAKLLGAYHTLVKLEKAGVVKGMASYPTEEERTQDIAPLTHLARIDETVNSMVRSGAINEKEADEKRIEIARETLSLPSGEAFKVIDRVKRAPEKPLSEVKEEVLSGINPERRAEPARQTDLRVDQELMRKTSVETVLSLIEARTLFHPKDRDARLYWYCKEHQILEPLA